ncbi:hypothetical protein O6H91_04G140400 [Diphasiastrum complanatum]|nr:hypothetical protein O6H91_Y317400 [Diphasiastrum complanatum]KAJ7287882.1 hypothetical protein O6H91_Y317400 [Diphasiastrum complanatum]KAJ7560684.1 hypothetical protein O6H91_04G140400 [Diphasiastrum complanatum]KAJ7560685.1 hypothetical protein O6H91_04G140400 [Diphasiastrum complanatum]
MIVTGVYFLGSLFLTLSVSVSGLKPPRCIPTGSPCPKPRAQQVGFFYFSLYLISLGTGGLKPNLEALGADQFDEQNPAEKLAKTSFFNWWYFGLVIGGTVSSTVIVYIQDNVGWGWGFGVPTVAIAVAFASFCIGTPVYRHKPPSGSALTSVAQVLVASARKWNISVPADKDELYELENKNAAQARGRRRLLHTDEFLFLDKAAAVRLHEDAGADTYNPWRLCTVTQVEEVKLVLRVMPIWTTSLVYGIINAQTGTFFIKQGATLDNRMGPHFKLPPASMQNVLGIVILVFLPMYDRFLVPFLRRFSRNARGISLLQRLGIGLFFSLTSMVAAALTESKRLKVARQHGLLDKPFSKLPMSIFQLSPQYALFGFADVFFIVGLQEFFYDQMPDTMRSMALALYLSTIGVGSFLSSLCITVVNKLSDHGNHTGWISSNLNKSHLDFFYWFLVVLSFINLGLFFLFSRWYKYKQEIHAPESASIELDMPRKSDTEQIQKEMLSSYKSKPVNLRAG